MTAPLWYCGRVQAAAFQWWGGASDSLSHCGTVIGCRLQASSDGEVSVTTHCGTVVMCRLQASDDGEVPMEQSIYHQLGTFIHFNADVLVLMKLSWTGHVTLYTSLLTTGPGSIWIWHLTNLGILILKINGLMTFYLYNWNPYTWKGGPNIETGTKGSHDKVLCPEQCQCRPPLAFLKAD